MKRKGRKRGYAAECSCFGPKDAGAKAVSREVTTLATLRGHAYAPSQRPRRAGLHCHWLASLLGASPARDRWVDSRQTSGSQSSGSTLGAARTLFHQFCHPRWGSVPVSSTCRRRCENRWHGSVTSHTTHACRRGACPASATASSLTAGSVDFVSVPPVAVERASYGTHTQPRQTKTCASARVAQQEASQLCPPCALHCPFHAV